MSKILPIVVYKVVPPEFPSVWSLKLNEGVKEDVSDIL